MYELQYYIFLIKFKSKINLFTKYLIFIILCNNLVFDFRKIVIYKN